MDFTVENVKARLDKFLVANMPQFSRTILQRFIKTGAVGVNSHSVIKSGFLLKQGDRVAIADELINKKEEPYHIEPDASIPLDIAYEDDDIVVINKPAGLIVHPTPAQPTHTLAHALVARYPKITTVGESVFRPGIVHRLDKDTSGLLIVAKTEKSFAYMKQQFLNHAVKKTYLALVHGIPKKTDGVIEYPIRPSTRNRLKKVAVLRLSSKISEKQSTRAARTLYHVREVIEDNALLEVQPETGRTHQIRVHLTAIGHPIVGDALYGHREAHNVKRETLTLSRQFLHAYKLEFVAPNGKTIKLESKLPKDLEQFLH